MWIYPIVLCASLMNSQPAWVLPAPLRYVADYAGILDDQTEDRLNNLLQSLELRTDVPFVVLTVGHTNGVQLPWYVARTAIAWGLRRQEKDRGVLLVYVAKDQALRLEYGSDLREAIPANFRDELEDRFRSYIGTDGLCGAIYLSVQFVAEMIAKAYNVSLLSPTSPSPSVTAGAHARPVIGYLVTAWMIIGLVWVARYLSSKWRTADRGTEKISRPGSPLDPFGGGLGPFGTSQSRSFASSSQGRRD